MAAIVVNGWTLYAHPLLLDQIDKLEAAAKKSGDPQSVPHKVLALLQASMFEEIPQNPGDRNYSQGKTLGKGKTHWFRDHIGGRFRLFFRFDSRAKVIVYAWVNDEETLRTYGSKTDAYAVFRSMVDAGDPPNSWSDLLKAAEAAADRFTTANKEARAADGKTVKAKPRTPRQKRKR